MFGLSDKQRLETYLGGLKPYIQKELKLHDITNIEVARCKAKAVEAKFDKFQPNNAKTYSKKDTPETTETYKSKYIPPPKRDDKRSLEAQRMKEGKCRQCGDRWDPKHKCRSEDNSQKLYTCEAEENSEPEEEESEGEEEGTQNTITEDNNTPKISLAAMTGISQPQTLKLKGHINKENVTVLIDTGSTHNFIDIKVARKLNLFVYPVLDMKVMVADGKKIEKVGKCHKVKLQIQDFKLESELYTLPLGGVDIVLGV